MRKLRLDQDKYHNLKFALLGSVNPIIDPSSPDHSAILFPHFKYGKYIHFQKDELIFMTNKDILSRYDKPRKLALQ